MAPRKQPSKMQASPSSPTPSTADPTPLLPPSSSSPSQAPRPSAAHLFTLVPGLLTGSLYPALVFLAWLLYTVLIPLCLLLPLSFSYHPWPLRALLLSMSATGVLLLLVLTSPLPLTLYRLRGTDPPSRPPLAHPTHPPASHRIHVRRALVLVNPHGGTRDNRALYTSLISPYLHTRGVQCEVRFTERSGQAREWAQTLPLAGFDCIVVVGGDGTLHEVANGLMGRQDGAMLPVALVPLGTGNAVATDLGTWDVERALQRVVEGEVSYIDLNHITSPSTVCPLSLYSVETITWGLIGTVAVQAELPLMRRLGIARFDLCALLNVLKGYSAGLELKCGEYRASGAFVTVYLNNTQYFARLLRAAPRAVMDDGKMDVLMLQKASRSLLLAGFVLLKMGGHVGVEGVRYMQGEEVWMRPGEGRGVINVDGEIVEFEGELTVRCVRKALPMMMESTWRGREIKGLHEKGGGPR